MLGMDVDTCQLGSAMRIVLVFYHKQRHGPSCTHVARFGDKNNYHTTSSSSSFLLNKKFLLARLELVIISQLLFFFNICFFFFSSSLNLFSDTSASNKRQRFHYRVLI